MSAHHTPAGPRPRHSAHRAIQAASAAIILLALGAGGLSLHGYAVIEALKQGGGDQFQISEQAVYPALRRLEHLGLVSSSWSRVDGRTRRTYSITPEGREQLKTQWRTWEELSAVVAKLAAGRRAAP